MSSEDESEAGAHLKKNKRTRQRVDAGEPRNSYASIPNFCSRPTLHVPPTTNGAKMLNELLATTRTNNLRCDVDFASDSTVDSTDLSLRLNGVPPTNGGGSDSSSCGGLLLEMAGPPDSPPNLDGGDRSHLLREILQGKKSEANACTTLITQLLKASGPVNKSNERSSERNGSKEECNDEMAAGNELHSPEESVECNGGRGKMNGTGAGEGGGGGAQSTQSAAELKRARVETIVSGMRCSPVRDTVSSMAVNGCKKRKHYQPQQHEAVTASRLVGELEAAESPPKQRRVEREVLRKQLREIQQQLVQMQQRYFELFEAESSDSEVVGSSQSDDGGNGNVNAIANAADLNNAAQEIHLKSEETDAMQPTCAADLMDPAHFIDEARRLVNEQEKLAKEAIKFPLFGRISTHNNNNVFGGGQFTVDVEGLSEALKTEIAASLTILVDSILNRYVRRTKVSSSSLLSTSSSSLEIPKDVLAAASQMLDRRSPRTKIIDRGSMNHIPIINTSTPVSRQLNGFGSPGPFHDNHPPTIKHPPPPPNANALVFPPNKSPMSLYNHHPSPPLPLSFMSDTEQNEALSLVVTPRKKRHKVTDTRITPRTVSRLLNQEPEMKNNGGGNINNNNMSANNNNYPLVSTTHPDNNNSASSYHPPPLVPVSLPTSVAIPNPSLHQSDVFSYPYYQHPHAGSPPDTMDDEGLMHPGAAIIHNSLLTSNRASPDHLSLAHMKNENGDGSDCNSVDVSYDNITPVSSTLTPMHLRKAKLMFFFVRYPSSAILKMYFPDIKFNKNNTAQLVKWFSNFREFYYIQMEKYARQAMSEGAKCAEELSVNIDSELYRVLNLHYNRNNHIEVPVNFRFVVEQTLREFFKAIAGGKDQEQSWKKSIYKVIARMDDNLPEYFKSPNFLEQLE